MAAMPTMTAVPPGRIASTIWSVVASPPIALRAKYQPRPLDDITPPPAAADHQHRRARLDLRAMGHRAHARRHAAAHERRLRPRHLLADRHQHLGGGDGGHGE